MTKHMKKTAAVLALSLMSAALAGCSQRNWKPAEINKDPYERVSRRTVEVRTGDLCPTVRLTLQVEGYERVAYGVSTLDLSIDRLYVSPGDKVKAGDLLVSFQSEGLQNTIEAYERQCADNGLLIEHLRRLMEIDGEADYSSDIRMLSEDIEIAKLYIEEARAKLQSYQIVARSDGTIVNVDDFLMNGFLIEGRNLITQICGTGNYTAKTSSTYQFAVGDTYTATSGIFSYDLKITNIEAAQALDGRMEQLLTFEPVSDMSAVSDAETLTMIVERPTLENVVYVETLAVHEVDGNYFVYEVDENGFNKVVWVKIGEAVDSYRVITEGLIGGEKVCLD